MEQKDVVEDFYGVYLLKSLNPKYKGRTYIGFTVDPNRRIKQHNRGRAFGGAWRTSHRGPWEMVLTVHGFPSDVSALRFEWAWQHPKRSRRLKNVIGNKKSSETSFDYNIKIMFTMLSTPPWSRLPLTVRWLSADAVVEAPPNLAPPAHMPMAYGAVVPKKVKKKLQKTDAGSSSSSDICAICTAIIGENDVLRCLNTDCTGVWHMLCLADKFVEEEMMYSVNVCSQMSSQRPRKRILPVEGSCPQCKSFILWGDLIRKKKGCYSTPGGGESSFSDCDVDASKIDVVSP